MKNSSCSISLSALSCELLVLASFYVVLNSKNVPAKPNISFRQVFLSLNKMKKKSRIELNRIFYISCRLFFNKVSMMFIIYFHASKNGTNLPDVKTYCNKIEQLTISSTHLTLDSFKYPSLYFKLTFYLEINSFLYFKDRKLHECRGINVNLFLFYNLL